MKKLMKPGRRYFIINIDEPYAEKIYEVLKQGQTEKEEWPEGDICFEEWKAQAFGREEKTNHKYYFTFGSSGQIYNGGWVEIHAATAREAQEKFISHFGKRAWKFPEEHILNYSFLYTENEFKDTVMYQDNDNLGAGCHEIIK